MKKTLPELYLEKRDELSKREREAILTAIELMNKPIFNITSEEDSYFINDGGFAVNYNPTKDTIKALQDNK